MPNMKYLISLIFALIPLECEIIHTKKRSHICLPAISYLSLIHLQKSSRGNSIHEENNFFSHPFMLSPLHTVLQIHIFLLHRIKEFNLSSLKLRLIATTLECIQHKHFHTICIQWAWKRVMRDIKVDWWNYEGE